MCIVGPHRPAMWAHNAIPYSPAARRNWSRRPMREAPLQRQRLDDYEIALIFMGDGPQYAQERQRHRQWHMVAPIVL